MKKILEKIGKNEIIEYFRSSNTKFAVGNYVGAIQDFAVFTSITPFGKNEGYRFVKFKDLKQIGKSTEYLQKIEKKIEMRNFKDRKTVILKKEKFFNNLFEYFIKNKVMLRIIYKDDNVWDSYLIKITKDYFYFQILENPEYSSIELVRKDQIKYIEIGKHNLQKIEVEDQKIEKNKFIDACKEIQGDVIFQDDNYVLIYEKDLFYGDNEYILIRKNDVWEISEKVGLIETKDISLEKIFPDILELSVFDILKKCYNEKVVVDFEYDSSYYEKYGIIEKIQDERLILKEIDKNSGVFVRKCEIKFDEISFIFLKNYSILKI